MPDAIERKEHNAAFAPDRGYFNIPIVGGVNLSATGNIALGDFIYPVNGELVTLFDTGVSADKALSPLNKGANYYGLDGSLTIIGFGKYMKDKTSFWSFDLNMKFSSNISAPYELFEFIKTAPESTQIKDINVYADTYAEAVFGHSRKINEKLTVGANIKFLVGLANMELNIDQLDATLNQDVWEAEASGSLDVNMKGVDVPTDAAGQFEMGDIDMNSFGPAGYGAAIDLGATYDLFDNLQLSASVNDIGFIRWSANNNLSASVANEFVFEGGSTVIDDNGASDIEGMDDIELDDILFDKGQSRGSSKWLQANLNLGAEYLLWDNRVGVGAVYSARFWRCDTIHNFMLGATLCPTDWFTAAASYTVTNCGQDALGFALNFAPRFINFYIATDILTAKKSAQFIPINQSMMNFSFGLAVPIGQRGERASKGPKSSNS